MKSKVENAVISRRVMLRTLMAFSGVAAGTFLLGHSARAQKASREAMQYQEQPMNGQKCSGCSLFIPGESTSSKGACQVVEGDISPQGWCVSFTPKA